MTLYPLLALLLLVGLAAKGRASVIVLINEPASSPLVTKTVRLHSSTLVGDSVIRRIEEAWATFKTEFAREFQSVGEEEQRLVNFVRTFVRVEEHNKLHDEGKKYFRQAINKFADWHDTELKHVRGYRSTNSTTTSRDAAPPVYQSPNLASAGGSFHLPSQLDWRTGGYVTPVKDQGQCGSCWSFSSTGSLEGQHFRKTGKLVSLSEQQLVDCNLENNGCEGGIMQAAFTYIKNKGIELENTYPYVSGKTEHRESECHFNDDNVITKDAGFMEIPQGSEKKLMEAVATVGPISVAIDASQPDFMSYASGVYDSDACTDQLDHAVLLVGYGTEAGVPYWLVKNSWSPKWGDEGYIKMRRNKNNMCGIANMAVYPLL